MTFLNAALLTGLAAVVLPILIHLFSRRRYPQIEFSTLRFLKKLQRQQMRRLKLRQWLLLLLRTLAILLIALAFARPTLTENFSIGRLSAGRTTTAVVLDGSASMQARTAYGTTLKQAVESIRRLIRIAQPGDQAIVIVAKDEPDIIFEGGYEDFDKLEETLSGVAPWDGSADLFKAVALAADKLHLVQDFRSELVIISDFATESELPLPTPNVASFFIPLAPEAPQNVSVAAVKVLSDIIEPSQPVEIEVTFSNHGSKPREDVYYSVFLNGVRVGENVVSISPGSDITRKHLLQPKDPGLQKGFVQIEESDLLAIDNRRYFCFSIPENLQVLLVGEQTTVRPVEIALQSSRSESNLVQLTRRDRNHWDLGRLSEFGVIIFVDPPPLSSAQNAQLAQFVESGGGLFILPGSGVDVAAINRGLFSRLKLSTWGEKIGQPGRSETFLTWREEDLESSLFLGVFRKDSDPSTPRFYQSLTFPEPAGEVLLKFSDGSPFLIEHDVGQGQVMLAASSPDRNWSDWSLRGIFAPLLHRIVLKLGSRYADRCVSYQVGDDLVINPRVMASATAQLLHPDGQEEQIPLKSFGQTSSFFYPDLDPAGLYELRNDQYSYLAAVNLPAGESDFASSNPATLFPEWFANGAIQVQPENLETTVQASRHGRELWKVALAMGLCVLVLESFLGTSRSKNEG